MSALGQHLMLRFTDDRIMTPSLESRCAFARTVLRIGRPFGLLFFAAAGTHSHTVLIATESEAARFAQALECALRWALQVPVPFERYRRKPVLSQAHLYNLRSYVLGNARRHGDQVDPYLEASNLPDLLGLRVIGAYTCGRARELLPKLTREQLLEHLGLSDLGEGDDVRHLADSAAASVAAPTLAGRQSLVVQARIAATHLGLALGASKGWLARHLGLSKSGLRHVVRQTPDPSLAKAIRRQLWLREHLPLAPANQPIPSKQ